MKLIRWISASAGTGKTYKINEIIDSLVQGGVRPSSILCLSFTRQAASEMRYRYLTGPVGKQVNEAPRFETIHKFANSLLDEDRQILNEEGVDELIKEAVEVTIDDQNWFAFFESIHESWPNVISDIKHIISCKINLSNASVLNKYINKSASNKLEVKLSDKTEQVMKESGLTNTLNKMYSNSLDIYMDTLITKDFKLNKKYFPESFMTNPNYAAEAEEIENAMKKALNKAIELTNANQLSKTITANLFIKEVCNKYQTIKNARNLMDFNDMIKLSIGKISDISEKIKNIRHVLLDEAQDTSPVQWKLVYALAMEILQFDNSSFTAVGDKKQVIYEFNGASKSVLEYMKNKLKSAIKSLGGEWRENELNQSYRSSQTILDFIDTVMDTTKYQSKHLAARDMAGFIKTWLPMKNEKDNIMMDRGWKIPGKQILPEWISLCVGEVKNLLSTRLLNENRLVRPSDIMFLIPRRCINTFLLVEELKKNNIPIAESPFSIITDETIQELVGIGDLVLDMSNDLVLASILKGPYFKWTNEQIEAISIDREDTLWNTICNSTEPHVVEAAKVFSYWNSLEKDLFTFYSKVLFETEYGTVLSQVCRNEVMLFWEQVVQHSSSTLAEFVHKMKNSHDPVRANREGIVISTVHCSKGREANIIFLCSSHATLARNLPIHIMQDNMLLLKGNYAMYKNAKSKTLMDQENESDRLMYVALTRAKEQIYILPPLSTDNINPKSWYSKIIRNIQLFKQSDDSYNIGEPPRHYLTKYRKYN